MKVRHILLTATISFVSAFTVLGIFNMTREEKAPLSDTFTQPTPVHFTNYWGTKTTNAPERSVDFTHAARLSTPTVVHVKTTSAPKTNYPSVNPFQHFFYGVPRGYEPQPQMGSGSGVIISEDGYIVTNNHVIKDADNIQVVLSDNREYAAELIGSDPSTDIALLKVEADDLTPLPFGNSDSLMVGEWVMAVGNPFNLASTVTAGIVSAKGRNINILEDNGAIESFIQTDAAVNPGNSGGALVDLDGRLVGINSAIASPTGSYSGYSFAVPANLVSKVVYDLKEFGIVQRGFLGVTIRNVDSELAKKVGTKDLEGVYIDQVVEGSAADDAGIRPGDIIKTINGTATKSSPQLQETLAQYRPGDNVLVTYMREGKPYSTRVKLHNKNQGTELLTKGAMNVVDALGVELTELSKEELQGLGIRSGVRVSKINSSGKVKKYTNMREGFIITRIDRQAVEGADDVMEILENKRGGVMIEGIYPDHPGNYYYAFGM